jgi:capsular exopolysaccharide synthesis family protein
MINFSELLWKRRRAGGAPLSAFSNAMSGESEDPPELRDVPVEEVKVRPESRIVLLSEPRSPGADRFRLLRMRLRELAQAVNLRRLLITSPMPEDGKTTIALNLATALAEGGKRYVLLLEADIYRPTLVPRLGLQPEPGLAECLEEGLDPLSLLRRVQPMGFYCLPAGEAKGNPTELLQSEAFSNLIERLSPYFEWILLDTPPVAPLADAVSLLAHVDGTLLVVRAGQTPQEAVSKAVEMLGPKHLAGIVFNAAQGLDRVYSDYYEKYAKK